MVDQRRVFVSYRREQFERARLIRDRLTDQELDVFLDVLSVHAGRFDETIPDEISARPFFVLVLAHGSLRRCWRKGDWLWLELEHAYRARRTFVPVLSKDYTESEARQLPPELRNTIKYSQSVILDNPNLFDAQITQIAELIKGAKVPVTATQLTPKLKRPQPPRRLVVAAVAGAIGVILAALLGVAAITEKWPFDSSATTTASSSPSGSDQSTVGDTAGTSLVVPAQLVDELKPDEELHSGETLATPNGRHVLAMTAAGVLELRTDDQVVWQSDGPAVANAYALLQADGNLVILPPEGAPSFPDPLWDLKTSGYPNAELIVAEDVDGSGYIAVVSLDRTEQFFRTPIPVTPTTETHGSGTPAPTEPTTSADKVTVPPLVGEELQTVSDKLTELGLVPVVDGPVDEQFRYVVVALKPKAGTAVDVGSTVDLTPDLAATTLTFPVQLLPNGGAQVGPTCSGGRYVVPELKWSGTNVATTPTIKITPTPVGTPATVTWAASTNGKSSGKVSSFTVACSNTASVPVEMRLSALPPPPDANEQSKTYSFTISPPPVIG